MAADATAHGIKPMSTMPTPNSTTMIPVITGSICGPFCRIQTCTRLPPMIVPTSPPTPNTTVMRPRSAVLKW